MIATKKGNEAGISMLEMGMSIPVVVFLVLLTIDLSNFIRAQTVLREAAQVVTTAARKIDSRAGSAEGDTQIRLFDWFLYTQSVDSYNKTQVGSSLPQGIVPAPCITPPANQSCSPFFVGMGGGGAAHYDIDLNQALSLGEKALRAGIPNHRLNCAGAFCASLSAELTDASGNIAAVPTHVLSRTSLELPMLVLLHHPITISSTAIGILEKDLLDNTNVQVNYAPYGGSLP